MILGATLGVQIVLVFLALMSLWSWTSIGHTLIVYRRVKGQVARGYAAFSDAEDLACGLHNDDREEDSPLARVGTSSMLREPMSMPAVPDATSSVLQKMKFCKRDKTIVMLTRCTAAHQGFKVSQIEVIKAKSGTQFRRASPPASTARSRCARPTDGISAPWPWPPAAP